jgi:hypothetical protein
MIRITDERIARTPIVRFDNNSFERNLAAARNSLLLSLPLSNGRLSNYLHYRYFPDETSHPRGRQVGGRRGRRGRGTAGRTRACMRERAMYRDL